MWGNETENKYQLAAFLANANQESLSAFAYNMNPNYGINEVIPSLYHPNLPSIHRIA
jgi:hypothetical protein